MKRAIINQLGQLSEQLKGYVGALNYRYLNLCVKAEEVSLLPIQVPIEDELKNLEDVAYAGKRTGDDYSLYIVGDDYSLYIVPKIQDDMRDIQQAVMKFHPEFIQEVQKEKVNAGEDGGEQEVQLLRLKMPEVNDDRYDLLKQGVDTFYNMCKAEMEQAKMEANIQFATLSVDESPEDIDKLKKGVDETNDMWVKKRDQLRDDKLKEIEEAHNQWRDQLRDDKLKEIEEAHNQWLADQQASAQKKQEEHAAHNEEVGSSMRINSEDE